MTVIAFHSQRRSYQIHHGNQLRVGKIVKHLNVLVRLADGQAALDMLLRRRGIGDEVALGIDDAAAEAFLPAVNAQKHERGRQELERAAEREALIAALADQLAACAVEDGDAKPAAMPALQRGELSL